jgi:regulator of RNase E activity RraB
VIGYNAKATSSNTIVLGNPLVFRIGGPVGWTSSSDVRIKKNIRDIHYGLSTVMQLRPVEYTLISSDLKQVGFIAQEVNKLVPEVITGSEGDLEKGDILGITYANLVAVLTKAIQEQQKQIDGLNKQVEEQGKKIDYLTTLRDAQK